MRTLISTRNPFRSTRRLEQAYAWERIRQFCNGRGRVRLLDYGTYDGNFVSTVADSGLLLEGVGVDVNVDAIQNIADSTTKGVKLLTISKGAKLPFPGQAFDVVTLIGVLEHIHRQDQLLTELHRVLFDDGLMIVSVPGDHLFSFLDMGNLKFRFPRLHRYFYERRYGAQSYHERYVVCRNGLVGDIEVEKGWHEHFSPQGLKSLLLKHGFEVVDLDGYGFFFRPLHNSWLLSPMAKGLLWKLMLLDMRTFASAEIFVSCRKICDSSHAPGVQAGEQDEGQHPVT